MAYFDRAAAEREENAKKEVEKAYFELKDLLYSGFFMSKEEKKDRAKLIKALKNSSLGSVTKQEDLNKPKDLLFNNAKAHMVYEKLTSMENEISKQKRQLDEYQEFFSMLKGFLPRSFGGIHDIIG